jgi:acetate kinase
MGMTPVAGIIMGTRSGNIDPGIIAYLAKIKGMSIEELDHVLTHESGLKGICGLNDMRDIHRKATEGDMRAQLALDMFVRRIKKYIGNYLAILGRLDRIVFTAGIGEHDVAIRARCCEKLERLGIVLDPEKSKQEHEGPLQINKPESAVALLVIPTNHENHEDFNYPPHGAVHRLSRLLIGLCPAGEQAVVLGHGWNPYYLFGWPVNRL